MSRKRMTADKCGIPLYSSGIEGCFLRGMFYPIFGDFLGFSAKMFYQCFTKFPKCFTKMAITDIKCEISDVRMSIKTGWTIEPKMMQKS